MTDSAASKPPPQPPAASEAAPPKASPAAPPKAPPAAAPPAAAAPGKPAVEAERAARRPVVVAAAPAPAAKAPPPAAPPPAAAASAPPVAAPPAQAPAAAKAAPAPAAKPAPPPAAKPAPEAKGPQAPAPASAVVPDGLLERARREAERQRRHKSRMVGLRLFLFVIAPTLLTAYYLHYWATPYYESETTFTIQSSETSSIPSLETLGGQFTGVANAQDAATIQEFILSRNTMRRIQEDEGYLSHFRSEKVDPLRRLSAEADEDAQLEFYRKRVKVSFNPNDKVMTLSAQATDARTAQQIVGHLLSYSEEKINDISSRIRDDQLRTADRALEQRRVDLRNARQAVLNLQQRYGEPDPQSILATMVSRLAGLETTIATKNAEYQAMQWNPGGDGRGTQAGRKLLAEIDSLRDVSRQVGGEIAASAPRLNEFEAALFERETRQTIWTSAVAASEQAQAEALRQHRYLAVINDPLAPIDPRYPQVMRSTLLVLVFFFFLYNILALIFMAIREHAKI
ncbi:hypothetical protein [Neomegalonema perideroedes]|uniref:hypothetical protein n=1 Tax=Neomegalonema perideroedes TaxID=217219 RepID=UPI0003733D57|nr:hypothetical protein [Neomegalonema perideroedes]